MAIILYPGTDNYATVTVSGLYDNNTEAPLFSAVGSTVSTSGIVVGGTCAQGNFETLQLDQSFNLLTFPGIQFVAGQAWSSATAVNTVQYLYLGNTTEGAKTGAPAYVIQLDQTTTLTGGAVTFQGTYDNINWVTIPVAQVVNPNTFAQLTNPYSFVASTNQPFLILAQGYAQIRIQLTTVITGTGTVTPYWSALSYIPTASTGSEIVSGNLTNNNAAPIGNNLGVLGAIAATAYTTQTYTNGNQVLLVTDLHGALNSDVQAVAGVQLGATAVVNFGSAPAAVAVPAVNSSIFSGTTALTNTGGALNVNITGSSGNTTVVGTLTNNNAAPAANNLGVLGYIANGAAVGTAPTPKTYTNGDQVLAVTSDGGSTIVVPADEYYASSVSYFGTDSGVTANNPSGNVPILSIRSSSATVNFIVRSIQGATNGALGVFRLYKNPTLTGATFAATAPSGSHVTVDTAATAYSAVGTQLWSGYSGTGSVIAQQMLQYLAAGAPGDIISLGWQKVGSGTANPYGAINWSEEAVVL